MGRMKKKLSTDGQEPTPKIPAIPQLAKPEKKDLPIYYSSALELKVGPEKMGHSKHLFLVTGIKKEPTMPAMEEIDAIYFHSNEQLLDGKTFRREVSKKIREANPRKITLLYTADTLWQEWKYDHDFSYKPNKIMRQIKSFYEASCNLIDDSTTQTKQFFFACIKPEWREIGKTLDLLFLRKSEEGILIKEHLIGEDYENKYFKKINITATNEENKSEWNNEFISRFLGTGKAKSGAEACYALHKDEIGSEEFIFEKVVWQKLKGSLERKKHVDADKFIRLRDRICLVTVNYLGQNNIKVTDLVPYGMEAIKTLYGKDFIYDLPYYDGIDLVPDNSENYKRDTYIKEGRVTYKNYNMYEPVGIVPKEGATWADCPNIIKYLKHLSQGKATPENPITKDKFTLLIDWTIVAYKYPMQRLPMLTLVNKERGTGKSTWLDFWQQVFGPNAIKTTMDDLLGTFNSHNSFKTWTLLEEVKMEGDKDVHMNDLKEMITGRTRLAHPKGLAKYQISNYTRFIAASNFEDNLFKVDNENEDRFFVLKPPKLTRAQKDKDLLEKMIAEAPAFLYCLLNADPHHPAEDRLWFSGEDIRTEEFYRIYERSKPFVEREVEGYMKDLFLTYNISQVRMNSQVLSDILKGQTSYWHSPDAIKEVFKNKGYAAYESTASTLYIPVGIQKDEDGLPQYIYYEERIKNKSHTVKPKKRYWTCEAKDWLSPEEFERIRNKTIDDIDMDETDDLTSLQSKISLNGNAQKVVFAWLLELPAKGDWEVVENLQKRFNKRLAKPMGLTDFTTHLKAFHDEAKAQKRAVNFNKDFSKIQINTPF